MSHGFQGKTVVEFNDKRGGESGLESVRDARWVRTMSVEEFETPNKGATDVTDGHAHQVIANAYEAKSDIDEAVEVGDVYL